ncbi:hypothetical protein H4R34_004009 [Dimargaris verticillata]|uniref:F-box domain-containing protein n=1 Tax=Dimargaris verticillata TaxID=2761393 RepID=A0A9W8B1A6_9FUNG|nr:hypothetical protein H4R34_004009 [Dimargaris verticillata]
MDAHWAGWWASLPRLAGACVCTIVQACIPQRPRPLPVVRLLQFLYQLWQEERTSYKGPWTAIPFPAVEPLRHSLRPCRPKCQTPPGLQQPRMHAGYGKPTKSHAVPWCVTYTFRRHRPTTTIQTLPPEVLQQTFGWLPTRQDRVNCALVCRRWHTALRPLLWRAPTLYSHQKFAGPLSLPTTPNDPVAANTVATLIPENVRGWLAALPWTRPLLTQLADVHDGLRDPWELLVQMLGWLPQRLYYDEVGLPTHWSFIDHGRHIRKLDFSGGQALVTDQTLGVVAGTCSALTHLSLNGCATVTAAGLAEIALHCIGLRTLVLDDCPAVQDESIERLVVSCTAPGLRTLSLANATRITDRSLLALATHQPKLAKLSLPGCRGVGGSGIQALVERCRALVWLDLSSIPDVDHATVVKVANQCSQLERLNLAYTGMRHYQLSPLAVPLNPTTTLDNEPTTDLLLMSPRHMAIDDQTVGYVVRHSAKLRVLNLDYLPTLTNQAIHYIASHGDALVSLSFVGCPRIDQRALVMLAQLRDRTAQLVSLTLGDSPLITEETVNVLTREPTMVTQGWQRTIIQDHALPRYLRNNFWAH